MSPLALCEARRRARAGVRAHEALRASQKPDIYSRPRPLANPLKGRKILLRGCGALKANDLTFRSRLTAVHLGCNRDGNCEKACGENE